MQPYAVVKGVQMLYSPQSLEDPAGEPAKCFVCGEVIYEDEDRFVNWTTHVHVQCARDKGKVVGLDS